MLIMNFFSRISRHNLNNWTRKLIRRFHRMSRKRGMANDSAKIRFNKSNIISIPSILSLRWTKESQCRIFYFESIAVFLYGRSKRKDGKFLPMRISGGRAQTEWSRPIRMAAVKKVRAGTSTVHFRIEQYIVDHSWFCPFFYFGGGGGGGGGFKSVSSGSSTHRRHHGPHTTLSLFYENEST